MKGNYTQFSGRKSFSMLEENKKVLARLNLEKLSDLMAC
jgi:hypothetical protein